MCRGRVARDTIPRVPLVLAGPPAVELEACSSPSPFEITLGLLSATVSVWGGTCDFRGGLSWFPSQSLALEVIGVPARREGTGGQEGLRRSALMLRVVRHPTPPHLALSVEVRPVTLPPAKRRAATAGRLLGLQKFLNPSLILPIRPLVRTRKIQSSVLALRLWTYFTSTGLPGSPKLPSHHSEAVWRDLPSG